MPDTKTFCEALEPRRLFAGTAHLVFGSLNVAGNGPTANTIVVGNSADALSIEVSIQWTNAAGQAKTFAKTFLADNVRRLIIHGGGRGDGITIDQTHSGFAKNTIIDGFGGTDTITAGDEDDRIAGLAGNDVIDAGNGNNTVRGGDGNDNIVSGSGNDKINGGSGNDSITSGAGDDIITGGGGIDVIDGGDGN